MANIRLVALFAVLIILSLPQPSTSNPLQAFLKIFKLCRRCFGPLGTMMDLYDLYKLLEDVSTPKDGTSASIEDDIPDGFYINFSVGNPMQPLTARISISNLITLLENYELSYSSTHQCCITNLNCSAANCASDYYMVTDTFTFQTGHLDNVPYMYNLGDKLHKTTGLLCFSRSPNSLLRTAEDRVLSYLFSDAVNTSYFTLGGGVPTVTTLQSTPILANPNHHHLLYVSLSQLSIGSNTYEIDSMTNSSSVILDTVMTPTLLETTVYNIVKTEILNYNVRRPGYTDKENGLAVCYKRKRGRKKPSWPDLILSFPSNSSSSPRAQMVLTKKNYVVTIKKKRTTAECAAIFETHGASVIGIMAQIDRQMIIDLSSEPKLYFSMHS